MGLKSIERWHTHTLYWTESNVGSRKQLFNWHSFSHREFKKQTDNGHTYTLLYLESTFPEVGAKKVPQNCILRTLIVLSSFSAETQKGGYFLQQLEELWRSSACQPDGLSCIALIIQNWSITGRCSSQAWVLMPFVNVQTVSLAAGLTARRCVG